MKQWEITMCLGHEMFFSVHIFAVVISCPENADPGQVGNSS